MKTRKFTLNQIMEAARETDGTTKSVAKYLGADRQTIYRYVKAWPQLRSVISWERESQVGVVVDKEELIDRVEGICTVLEMCDHRCKNAVSMRHAGDCANMEKCKEARSLREDALELAKALLKELMEDRVRARNDEVQPDIDGVP